MRFLLAVEDAVSLKPRRLLEVAAGDGALSAVLASHGCEVVANDLRVEKLARQVARFRNSEEIQIVGGDLFDIGPEESGLFDLVIACEVLEHLAHADEFMTKLRRLLVPGGRLLITTPNGDFFRSSLPTWSEITDFSDLESRQFQPDADGHLFLITPDELSGLATLSGYTVERLYVWGSPFLTGNAKFSVFAHRGVDRVASAGEAAVQFLPAPIRSRLCTALVAVLRASQPQDRA